MSSKTPLQNMRVKQIAPSIHCKWMDGHGVFARMGVQGDGSCFFHSVCAMINKNGYLHANKEKQKEIAYEFRCNFTDEFSKKEYDENKTSASKNYKTTQDGFCIPKFWADEVMIKHAMKKLDINMIFLDVDGEEAYCGVHGKDTVRSALKDKEITQKMGIVAWVNKSHFELIVRVDDKSTGLITTLFDPVKKEKDRLFVEALMENYMKECNVKKA
jgi:hypothetical protein